MTQRRISEARETFSETVNRAAFGGERVVLTRHGKPVAAVVPLADLDLLEALEDRIDLDEARAALTAAGDESRVGWEELKAQLRL
jgi:prevent-host-death family protein